MLIGVACFVHGLGEHGTVKGAACFNQVQIRCRMPLPEVITLRWAFLKDAVDPLYQLRPDAPDDLIAGGDFTEALGCLVFDDRMIVGVDRIVIEESTGFGEIAGVEETNPGAGGSPFL